MTIFLTVWLIGTLISLIYIITDNIIDDNNITVGDVLTYSIMSVLFWPCILYSMMGEICILLQTSRLFQMNLYKSKNKK